MHQASDARYSSMPYHRCGKSGLLLPAVSLGFWHNFGDTGRYETINFSTLQRSETPIY